MHTRYTLLIRDTTTNMNTTHHTSYHQICMTLVSSASSSDIDSDTSIEERPPKLIVLSLLLSIAWLFMSPALKISSMSMIQNRSILKKQNKISPNTSLIAKLQIGVKSQTRYFLVSQRSLKHLYLPLWSFS